MKFIEWPRAVFSSRGEAISFVKYRDRTPIGRYFCVFFEPVFRGRGAKVRHLRENSKCAVCSVWVAIEEKICYVRMIIAKMVTRHLEYLSPFILEAIIIYENWPDVEVREQA